MPLLFKILGALGLLLITGGVINKHATTRNVLFTVGGILLLLYSIYLKDPVFIPLQTIFTSASLYELYKLNRAPGHLPISVSPNEVANLLTKK